MNDSKSLLSLHATNEVFPDHDFWSTCDNSEAFGIPSDAHAWGLEAVPVAQIDPFQLIDDPDDAEGLAKIASIRRSMRDGDRLIPPVYVLHYPEREYPFFLVEGKHRYNAAHQEERLALVAWVGHSQCCGSSRST
jgi:hypothetical protein